MHDKNRNRNIKQKKNTCTIHSLLAFAIISRSSQKNAESERLICNTTKHCSPITGQFQLTNLYATCICIYVLLNVLGIINVYVLIIFRPLNNEQKKTIITLNYASGSCLLSTGPITNPVVHNRRNNFWTNGTSEIKTYFLTPTVTNEHTKVTISNLLRVFIAYTFFVILCRTWNK